MLPAKESFKQLEAPIDMELLELFLRGVWRLFVSPEKEPNALKRAGEVVLALFALAVVVGFTVVGLVLLIAK